MKRLFVLVFLIIIAALSCAPEGIEPQNVAPETQTTSTEDAPDVIQIGCLGDNLPYYGLDNGELSGPGIEMVRAVFDELDYPYEFVVLPWNRLILSMESGEIDLLLDTIHKEERERFLIYSKYPFLVQIDKFYQLKSRSISYDGSFDSISGYTVGIVSGYSYGEKIDEAKRTGAFQYDEASGYVENVEKLLHGRVDLIISNTLVASSYIDPDEVASLDPAISTTYAYVTFSKANDLQDLRDAYDKVYKQLIDDGSIQAILDAHNLTEVGESISSYDPAVFSIE